MTLLKWVLPLLFVAFAGCAHPASEYDAEQSQPRAEKYELRPITVARYLRYLQYKKELGPPLPGAPEIAITRQSIVENTCGARVIHAVGEHFGSEWDLDEITAEVMSTHPQGTSVTAIVKWFEDKGYGNIHYYFGNRDVEEFRKRLDEGCLIIPLIYSFRDGYGPNHYVVLTHYSETHFNALDSRIGEYSVRSDLFTSRLVLVQGNWVAVRP
ncbi:MAG: cysteine peptidase family C39 domain-containing protein [Planctomycetota bacterium]|nr:cysteine peptidase family C39 domain-containing protein [Planctomycetota bacterium]